MDIAKIQKLNNLAAELKRHNVVFDKEEALSKAEKIYGSDNNFSNETNIIKDHFDEESELKKDIRKLTFALKDAILEIKDLKVKVAKLERELNDIRVNNRPKETYNEPIHIEQQIEKPNHRAEQMFKEVNPEKKTRDLNTADRNGFKNDEISIEKFFYYGQK